MSENKEKPAPKAVAVEAEAEVRDFQLTLDEFCARLSQSDRRVEAIGGFHHNERTHDRLKDTEDAYLARFAAFMALPA